MREPGKTHPGHVDFPEFFQPFVIAFGRSPSLDALVEALAGQSESRQSRLS